MILLSNKIFVSLDILTNAQLSEIQADLTVTNPLFTQAMKMELSIFGKQQYLTFFEKEGDHLVLPSGYINTLLTKWPANQRPKIIDGRFKNEKEFNLEFKGKLKSFQQEACDAVSENSFGVIQAPTGAGKTIMMIYLIAQKKQPTIVLVDQIELGNQFVERVKQFTNLTDDQVGFIGNGKFSIRPLTVALLQSMHRLNDDYYEIINKNIGHIICDEVHVVAADTYYAVMTNLDAKYKFGFSATPKRVDGLTNVIFWAAGPIIHTIPFNKVSIITKPELHVVETNYMFQLFSVREYSDMINDLSIDDERNKLIINTLSKPIYKQAQKALLCTRVSQVLELNRLIPGSEILISGISKEDRNYFKQKHGEKAAKTLNKKTTKKHREEVIRQLNNGTLRTVVSTYGLFSKGIDIRTLELLAFCAPIRSEVIVKQCRGRVMRKTKNKIPVIIDFMDVNIELLKLQSKDRQYYLKEFD
jgi:superfamily II DNA or RNA helicase